MIKLLFKYIIIRINDSNIKNKSIFISNIKGSNSYRITFIRSIPNISCLDHEYMKFIIISNIDFCFFQAY